MGKLENYIEIAEAIGFQVDQSQRAIYGERNGYTFVIYAPEAAYPYRFVMTTNVKANYHTLTNDEIRSHRKENKSIKGFRVSNFEIFVNIATASFQNKRIQHVVAVVDGVSALLKQYGYEPCCGYSGETNDLSLHFVAGRYMLLTPESLSKLNFAISQKKADENATTENVALGSLGAFLGAMLGMAVMLVISRLGYVSMVSGFVMAICALYGYKLLGKKITRRGFVISILIMLFMIYLGDRIDWAIEVVNYYHTDFTTAFVAIPTLISEGYITMSNYLINLGMLYLFGVFGIAVGARTTANQLNQKVELYQVEPLRHVL